jgi:tetratricopeptide (TPR) repeat protein
MQAQSGVVGPVEATLQLYLANGPGDPHLIFEALVRGCLQTQSVERAHHYTSLWTRQFPDDWRARFWHGRTLEEGLRHDLAAEAYEQVLQQKPDYLEAHLRRGLVLQWRGRYPEALAHLQTYLGQRPNDATALLALARCQRSLGPPAELRKTLDRLFALPGEHPEGWVLRGQLELAADRPREALRWLEKAVQRIPHDREVNLALATTLQQLRRPAEAHRYGQRHREIDRGLRRMEELTKQILARPRDVALRHEAGATLVRLGQDAQAIRWFVSALLLDPRHPPTRRALADCIARLGDPKLTAVYRPLLADPPERKEQVP